MSATSTAGKLRALSVPQLRALTWKYAVEAKDSVDAGTLCIDPHPLNKQALIVHLSTTVANSHWKLAIPATPSLWAPVEATFSQMSKAAIKRFLTSVNTVSDVGATGRRKRQRGSAADNDNEAVDMAALDDDSSSHQHDGDSDVDGAHSPTEQQTQPPTSSTQQAKRARTSPPPARFIVCPNCDTAFTYGSHGLFCAQCGRQWKNSSSSSSSSTGASSSTSTQPTTWAGLGSFISSPLPQLMRHFPDRATELAPLPSTVIEKARSGQHHYTLADLLQTKALDPSAASSSVLGDRAVVMRFDDIGGLKVDTGIEATLSSSLAQRKRKMTSQLDIEEVIVFTLMGRIYNDRPDICEQLFSLLCISNEINRRHGFATALLYVDTVRYNFFNSVPPRTHVLNISTAATYSLSTLHHEVLNGIVFRQNATGTRWSTNSTSTAPSVNTESPSRVQYCRNWNREAACRETPCRWSHICAKCHSSSHPAKHCTSTAVPGSASPASGKQGTAAKGKAASPTSGAAPPPS
jgi:hypothetical protein